MIKRLLQVAAVTLAMANSAIAQVDANRADHTALDGVKWIGPTIARNIIDARKRGGPFKDWSDFEQRVKGIDARRALALSEAGLTIDGKGRPDRLRSAPGPKR